MSAADFGRQVGVSKQSMSGYLQGARLPRPDTLLRMAELLGVDVHWLAAGRDIQSAAAKALVETRDAIRAGRLEPDTVLTEVRGAGAVGYDELKKMVFGEEALPPLPLYGSAQGGDLDGLAMTELDLSEVLDYLRRPASLADDQQSYALTIIGASMIPRFKPGERVGVSPRARVEIGDDVIVQLRGENSNRVRQVLIKELVRRSATHITLAQYNPSRELRIERKDVLAMHKVKGHFL